MKGRRRSSCNSIPKHFSAEVECSRIVFLCANSSIPLQFRHGAPTGPLCLGTSPHCNCCFDGRDRNGSGQVSPPAAETVSLIYGVRAIDQTFVDSLTRLGVCLRHRQESARPIHFAAHLLLKPCLHVSGCFQHCAVTFYGPEPAVVLDGRSQPHSDGARLRIRRGSRDFCTSGRRCPLCRPSVSGDSREEACCLECLCATELVTSDRQFLKTHRRSGG